MSQPTANKMTDNAAAVANGIALGNSPRRRIARYPINYRCERIQLKYYTERTGHVSRWIEHRRREHPERDEHVEDGT